MRKFIFLSFIMIVACSQPEPNTPNVIIQKEYNKYVCGLPNSRPCDDFDMAGEKMATGSRWVYNEATNAYEWVTSDDNKKKAKDKLDESGKAMKKLYENAINNK